MTLTFLVWAAHERARHCVSSPSDKGDNHSMLYLGRGSVLLHRGRQRAADGVGRGRLHIVVAEAAEEGAEDAAIPLLLEADVGLRRR